MSVAANIVTVEWIRLQPHDTHGGYPGWLTTDLSAAFDKEWFLVLYSKAEAGDSYVVAYAKIIDDKRDGVYMQGVYFGGIATTAAEAEQVARDCVQSAKGGTIMPKIIAAPSDMSILEAMNCAVRRFEKIENQMILAEEIMNRAGSTRR